MIKRIIGIIVAALLVQASVWAEMSPTPQKFYECASVVLFFSALITLIASNPKNEEGSKKEI